MSHKKFIVYSLTIVLIFVSFNLLITEIFTRKVLIPNDVVYRKEQMLLNVKDDVKIVSLGDSHAHSGINVEESYFFNFANGGDPIPIWYFKLKWLTDKQVPVNTLLLELDYHIFSYYRTVNVETVTLQYAKYIDEPVPTSLGIYPAPNSYAAQVRLYSLQPNYSPIVHKALVKYLRKELQPPQMAENGATVSITRFVDQLEADRLKEAEKRVKLHLYNSHLINPDLLEYYERIIRLALDKGIRVVVIRYPLSNEYLSLINDKTDQEFSDVVAYLENKYGFSILDYRRAFDTKQELFSDQDHLNSDGSKYLGEMVIRDLKQYYISYN